jgi:hypothetical protein
VGEDMVRTFRNTARGIDLLYPPSQLRDLAKRFRYQDIPPGSLPNNGHISLRALSEHIEGNAVKKIEFLHYNTWLIEDIFEIGDIIKAVGGLPRFCFCLGFSFADLITEVFKVIDLSGICDILFPPIFSVCGVSVNPANDACKVAAAAAGVVEDLVDNIIGLLGDAVDAIFDILEVPLNIVIDCLQTILGFIFWVEKPIMQGPDLDDRAKEIGKQVLNYDIVSLCEVWKQKYRYSVLSQGTSYLTAYIGPPDPDVGAWEHFGSGLLVFSPTFPTEDGQNCQYTKSGVARTMQGDCDFGKAVDADQWARKGIQLTLIDVGYGTIELYSTHLYSGGDMPDLKEMARHSGSSEVQLLGEFLPAVPTDEEKRDVRKAQFEQLARFISDKHQPQNIAIVSGDFNTFDANPPERASIEREALNTILTTIDGIEFDDWYECVSPFLDLTNEVTEKIAGHTHRATTAADFKTIGEKDRSVVGYDDYCDERLVPPNNPTGDRIDYIFI